MQPIENIVHLKNQVNENFVLDSYVDSTGRTLKQYLITEEGAMLLIMGFTGEKAFAVQTKFISEFKRMSRIINNPTEVIAETGSAEAVLAWSLSQIRMANVLAKQMKENKTLTTTVEVQKQQIVEMKPKADYYNTVLQSNDVVPITYIAKDYGKSAIWMNTYLKDKGVQFKKGEIWLLYQKYAELGLTQSKTSNYVDKDGITHTKMYTYWTQRGRLFIYDLLKQDGILPLIEQE